MAEDAENALEENFRLREENQRLANNLQNARGNLQVYIRIRPETDGGDSAIAVYDERNVCHYDPRSETWRPFSFDYCFGPESSQEQVYREFSSVSQSVLDGFNATILAYGQTGSGKTYTMMGTPSNEGLSFRLIQDVVDASHSLPNTKVTVSMLEVYNEEIYDLLGASGKPLSIAATDRGVSVRDLVEVPIDSAADVNEFYGIGLRHRSTAETRMNTHSSRSHCVLTLMVMRTSPDGRYQCGRLHLVDLAGSERLKKSRSEGDRLVEAQNINRSLSALGDVIQALDKKQQHIPYRNSKLTLLLKDSLTYHSKVCMVCTIRPSVVFLDESICTLNFANRARQVELGEATKALAHLQYDREISALRQQIATLHEENVVLARNSQSFELERQQAQGKSSAALRKLTLQIASLEQENSALKTALAEAQSQIQSMRRLIAQEARQDPGAAYAPASARVRGAASVRLDPTLQTPIKQTPIKQTPVGHVVVPRFAPNGHARPVTRAVPAAASVAARPHLSRNVPAGAITKKIGHGSRPRLTSTPPSQPPQNGGAAPDSSLHQRAALTPHAQFAMSRIPSAPTGLRGDLYYGATTQDSMKPLPPVPEPDVQTFRRRKDPSPGAKELVPNAKEWGWGQEAPSAPQAEHDYCPISPAPQQPVAMTRVPSTRPLAPRPQSRGAPPAAFVPTPALNAVPLARQGYPLGPAAVPPAFAGRSAEAEAPRHTNTLAFPGSSPTWTPHPSRPPPPQLSQNPTPTEEEPLSPPQQSSLSSAPLPATVSVAAAATPNKPKTSSKTGVDLSQFLVTNPRPASSRDLRPPPFLLSPSHESLKPSGTSSQIRLQTVLSDSNSNNNSDSDSTTGEPPATPLPRPPVESRGLSAVARPAALPVGVAQAAPPAKSAAGIPAWMLQAREVDQIQKRTVGDGGVGSQTSILGGVTELSPRKAGPPPDQLETVPFGGTATAKGPSAFAYLLQR